MGGRGRGAGRQSAKSRARTAAAPTSPCVNLQARDLGAHHGALRDVDVEQALRGVVPGDALVGLGEGLRQVGPPQRFEIHRQKRHVGQLVAVAQTRIEFETVEDPRTIGQAEDVLGQEIPVAVDDVASRDAPRQQLGPAGDVAVDQ